MSETDRRFIGDWFSVPNQFRGDWFQAHAAVEWTGDEELAAELNDPTPVRVYRVENGWGEGPYRDGMHNKLDDMYRGHTRSPFHPIPDNDGIGDPTGKLHGFSSMDSLHRWFQGYQDALHEAGFGVAEYHVEPAAIWHGGHQVAFDPNRAEKKRWLTFPVRDEMEEQGTADVPFRKQASEDDDYLAEELRDNGAEINEDGTVTVYHRTDPEAASAIYRSGRMRGDEDGLFFSTRADSAAQGSGYGDAVVKFRIPLSHLRLDDVFGDEAHLRMPLRRAGDQMDVSDWLQPHRMQHESAVDEPEPNDGFKWLASQGWDVQWRPRLKMHRAFRTNQDGTTHMMYENPAHLGWELHSTDAQGYNIGSTYHANPQQAHAESVKADATANRSELGERGVPPARFRGMRTTDWPTETRTIFDRLSAAKPGSVEPSWLADHNPEHALEGIPREPVRPGDPGKGTGENWWEYDQNPSKMTGRQAAIQRRIAATSWDEGPDAGHIADFERMGWKRADPEGYAWHMDDAQTGTHHAADWLGNEGWYLTSTAPEGWNLDAPWWVSEKIRQDVEHGERYAESEHETPEMLHQQATRNSASFGGFGQSGPKHLRGLKRPEYGIHDTIHDYMPEPPPGHSTDYDEDRENMRRYNSIDDSRQRWDIDAPPSHSLGPTPLEGATQGQHDLLGELGWLADPVSREYMKAHNGRIHILAPEQDGTWLHGVAEENHRGHSPEYRATHPDFPTAMNAVIDMNNSTRHMPWNDERYQRIAGYYSPNNDYGEWEDVGDRPFDLQDYYRSRGMTAYPDRNTNMLHIREDRDDDVSSDDRNRNPSNRALISVLDDSTHHPDDYDEEGTLAPHLRVGEDYRESHLYAPGHEPCHRCWVNSGDIVTKDDHEDYQTGDAHSFRGENDTVTTPTPKPHTSSWERVAVKHSPFGEQMDFRSLGWTPVDMELTNKFEKRTPGFYHIAEYDDDPKSPTGYSWNVTSYAAAPNEQHGSEWIDDVPGHTPHSADAHTKAIEKRWLEESIRGGSFTPPMSRERPVMFPPEEDRRAGWSDENRLERITDKGSKPFDPLSVDPSSQFHPWNSSRLSSWEHVGMPLPGDEEFGHTIYPGQDKKPYPHQIEDEEGNPVYRKVMYSAKDADNEVFGSLVHRAVGANAARVVRDPDADPKVVMVQMQEGLMPRGDYYETRNDRGDRAWRVGAFKTPKGVLTGLGDLLTREGDAFHNNWGIQPNYEPYRYDFQMSRHGPERTGEVTVNAVDEPIHWADDVQSDFAHHFTHGPKEDRFAPLSDNPLHPEKDVPRITAALQALKPDYRSAERMDWHNELMKRWYEVAAHAKGTESVLEKAGVTLPHEQAMEHTASNPTMGHGAFYHQIVPAMNEWFKSDAGSDYGDHPTAKHYPQMMRNHRYLTFSQPPSPTGDERGIIPWQYSDEHGTYYKAGTSRGKPIVHAIKPILADASRMTKTDSPYTVKYLYLNNIEGTTPTVHDTLADAEAHARTPAGRRRPWVDADSS